MCHSLVVIKGLSELTAPISQHAMLSELDLGVGGPNPGRGLGLKSENNYYYHYY